MNAKGLLVLLSAALFGACNSAPESFTLPCVVVSEPRGASVEYRLVRQPNDALTPVHDPWVYIGRTPLRRDAEVPRLLLEKKTKLVLRVSKPGYRPVHKAFAGQEIDLRRGLEVDAQLDSMRDEALKEKLK